MIIKIIPENNQERGVVQEVEHTNIKEFFIFGNKKDTDGDMLDFHDWHGSYRFLMGSLAYFTDVISHERSDKEASDSQLRMMPKVVPGAGTSGPSMIKYGAGDIQISPQNELVSPDGSPLETQAKVIEMPPQDVQDAQDAQDVIADDIQDADETEPEPIEAMDEPEEEKKSKKSKTKR